MKGETSYWVIGLIITIAVLIIMMTVLFNIFKNQDTQIGTERCKTSVELNAKARLYGYEFSSKIDCPAKYETVSGNEDEIKRRIANNMFNCWDNFGRGELELFPPSDATFCSICSVMEFREKRQVSGIIEYLAKHDVPLTSGQKTYYEFLQGTKYDATIMSKLGGVGIPDTVDTSKPLSTIFVYKKDAKTTDVESASIGTMIGYGAGITVLALSGAGLIAIFAGGAIVGATGGGIGYWLGSDHSADWDARLLVIPFGEDSLKNLGCTYLPVQSIKNIN